MYRLAWAVPGSQVTDKNPAVRLDAWIGLAVTGQPIGLWSPRTGAPEASATGRDRTQPSTWHWSALGPHGIGKRRSLLGMSGHDRYEESAGHHTFPARTSGSGAARRRVRAPPPAHDARVIHLLAATLGNASDFALCLQWWRPGSN
jgi:hypothetical protein